MPVETSGTAPTRPPSDRAAAIRSWARSPRQDENFCGVSAQQRPARPLTGPRLEARNRSDARPLRSPRRERPRQVRYAIAVAKHPASRTIPWSRQVDRRGSRATWTKAIVAVPRGGIVRLDANHHVGLDGSTGFCIGSAGHGRPAQGSLRSARSREEARPPCCRRKPGRRRISPAWREEQGSDLTAPKSDRLTSSAVARWRTAGCVAMRWSGPAFMRPRVSKQLFE
jgi:hypothetical protein